VGIPPEVPLTAAVLLLSIALQRNTANVKTQHIFKLKQPVSYLTNKQTNKQASKQTNKQTNKQTKAN
jgi:hypothetical protein